MNDLLPTAGGRPDPPPLNPTTALGATAANDEPKRVRDALHDALTASGRAQQSSRHKTKTGNAFEAQVFSFARQFRDEITRLEDKNRELELRNSELEAAAVQFVQTKSQYQELKSAAQAHSAAASAAEATAARNASRLEAEVARMAANIKASEDATANLRHDMSQLSALNSSIEAQLEVMGSRSAQSTAALVQAHSDRDELAEQKSALAQALKRVTETFGEEIGALERENERLAGAEQRLAEKTTEHAVEMADVRRQCAQELAQQRAVGDARSQVAEDARLSAVNALQSERQETQLLFVEMARLRAVEKEYVILKAELAELRQSTQAQLTEAEAQHLDASTNLQYAVEQHTAEAESLKRQHSEEMAALQEELERERTTRSSGETQCRLLTAEVVRVQSHAAEEGRRMQDDIAKIQAAADADVNHLEAEVARMAATIKAQDRAAKEEAEAHAAALFEAQEAAAEAGQVFEARAAEIAQEASAIAEHVSRIGDFDGVEQTSSSWESVRIHQNLPHIVSHILSNSSSQEQTSSSWGSVRIPGTEMEQVHWRSPTSPSRMPNR